MRKRVHAACSKNPVVRQSRADRERAIAPRLRQNGWIGDAGKNLESVAEKIASTTLNPCVEMGLERVQCKRKSRSNRVV